MYKIPHLRFQASKKALTTSETPQVFVQFTDEDSNPTYLAIVKIPLNSLVSRTMSISYLILQVVEKKVC